jgi:hypothetical protein
MLTKLTRDDTEHGKAYYLASDVDAIISGLAVDRGDAVNLARNLKQNAIQSPTPKGLSMLVDAVVSMDAAVLLATN